MVSRQFKLKTSLQDYKTLLSTVWFIIHSLPLVPTLDMRSKSFIQFLLPAEQAGAFLFCFFKNAPICTSSVSDLFGYIILFDDVIALCKLPNITSGKYS